jgi:hypothetical protein
MSHSPDDPELEALGADLEREIDAMLRRGSVSDVAHRHTALGLMYERTKSRMRRYVAIKIGRADVPTSADYGKPFFQTRFGQWWDWQSVTSEHARTHRFEDIPDAQGEPQFDGARLCDDVVGVVENVREWLVNWSTAAKIKDTGIYRFPDKSSLHQ